MIHKSPLIQQVFTPEHASQIQKEQWFMHSIKEIHQRNPTIQSREQLMILNRSSLQYLLQSLQKMQQPMQKKVSFHENISSTSSYDRAGQDSTYSVTTQYSRNQPLSYSRQEDAFQERKRQYDSMLEKKTPPDVQFTEKEDTAISNMDELLEQQRKLRELDLPLSVATNIAPIQSTINPSIPVSTSVSTRPTNKYNPAAPVLTIHHDQMEEIEPIVLFEPKSEVNEDLQILKKEFEDFKKMVLEFITSFQPPNALP